MADAGVPAAEALRLLVRAVHRVAVGAAVVVARRWEVAAEQAEPLKAVTFAILRSRFENANQRSSRSNRCDSSATERRSSRIHLGSNGPGWAKSIARRSRR